MEHCAVSNLNKTGSNGSVTQLAAQPTQPNTKGTELYGREIRVVELFAGVGGIRLGLENANKIRRWTRKGAQGDGEPSTSFQSSQAASESVRHNRNQPNFEQSRNARPLQYTVVWSNEWDKYAAAIYRKNFGDKELVEGDIHKIKTDDIPDHDMLVGGFPCQPFSLAGKREGFEDCRGTLFFEIARILKTKRPPLFLLENVDGLRSHNNGDTFETIIRTLDELGYFVEWKVLNSKYFGVPQNRERVFFIGHLRERGGPQIYPIPGADEEVIEEGSAGGSDPRTDLSDSDSVGKSANWVSRGFELRKDDVSNAVRGAGGGASKPHIVISNTVRSGGRGSLDRHTWDVVQVGALNGTSQAGRVYSPDGLSPTIRTPSGGDCQPIVVQPCLTPNRPDKRQNGRRFKDDGEPMFTLTGQDIHGVMIANTVRAEHHNSDNAPMTVQDDGLIRRLTPKECGRLQGFPDNWAKIGVSNKNLSGEDCAKQIKANLKTKILRTIHVLNWDEYLIADQQQYKVFGNAVTVNVIQELGELILDYVEANPEVLAE